MKKKKEEKKQQIAEHAYNKILTGPMFEEE